MLRAQLRTALKTPVVSALRTPVLRAQSPVFSKQICSPFARFYSEEAKKDDVKTEEPAEITGQDEHALKEELDAAKKEVADLKDRYLRSVADFRNLQETTRKEIENKKALALRGFAKDLLETADTFEIALRALETSETIEKTKELKELIEGVQLTQKSFLNTLKRNGLEQIEAVGEKFDPNVHEAVFEAPQPDKEAGTVFFVQQPGYYLNKRVIRPAKVGVVRGD